ncbi:zf-HC2 domain-containing protein [candidate division WOR-3 bacterium]|nr:zf-HC2 domain-containing protein [candidate division WOR-3 bacterium]
MECKEIRNYLVDYIFEEFKKPWMKKVREHLSRCPNCSKESQDIRKTFEVMNRYGEVQVPEVLYHRLRQKVTEFKPHELKIIQVLRRPVPAYAFAAIVVIFGLLFGISKGIKREKILYESKPISSYVFADTSVSFIPSPTVRTSP